MPGPVTNFIVDEVNEMTISVEWRAPQDPNGIILDYTIFYRTAGTTENESLVISDTDPMSMGPFQRNIMGLMAFTDYVVWMRARTSAGLGSSTALETVRTDPASASAPTLTATVLNSTSIMLEWTYPSMPRGTIVGYVISSNASDSNVSADISVENVGDGIEVNITLGMVDDMDNQQFVFSSLTPFTNYSFSVRAYSFQLPDSNSPFILHLGSSSNTEIVQTDEGSKSERLSNLLFIDMIILSLHSSLCSSKLFHCKRLRQLISTTGLLGSSCSN